MDRYHVNFQLRGDQSFSRDVLATDVADAAFIGTLDLVHVINKETGEVSLEKDGWTTVQALALQVLSIKVTEL